MVRMIKKKILSTHEKFKNSLKYHDFSDEKIPEIYTEN